SAGSRAMHGRGPAGGAATGTLGTSRHFPWHGDAGQGTNMASAAATNGAGARQTSEGKRGAATAALARRLGLHVIATDELSIRRRRNGKGFMYLRPDGSPIRDKAEMRRLAALAVPPAYEDVLYAADPKAHLQAVG